MAKTGYLVGDQYTFADINVLPILFYVNRFPEGSATLKSTKNLGSYFQRHGGRPSFKATVPPPPPAR